MDNYFIGNYVKGYIGYMQKIIGKIFFNNIVFIIIVNNKIIYIVGRIEFKDVLENGLFVNVNYWFRLKMSFFGNFSF